MIHQFFSGTAKHALVVAALLGAGIFSNRSWAFVVTSVKPKSEVKLVAATSSDLTKPWAVPSNSPHVHPNHYFVHTVSFHTGSPHVHPNHKPVGAPGVNPGSGHVHSPHIEKPKTQ
jgi:hypothetical protein